MSSNTKATALKEEATIALVPKLRFPEFRNAEGWGEKTFGDLLDDIIDFRGRTPIKLGMEWGNGDITSLSANNVKNGFIDYKAECNLGSEELYQRWMGDVNLEKEDIIFTMEAPLGNALLLPDSRKYILSQRVVAFKTNPEVVNRFLIQLIWSAGFQDAIGELATGSTAKGINQKALKTVLVRIPTPAEQQKIAECLSSVDELIAAQARKVDALKTHKNGLMQQLFPREGETHPRLRFPEFQNSGEWEERKLGTVCDIQRGKFSHRPRNDPRFFGGPYPFIQTGDVVKSEGGAVIASQSLNEEGLAVSKLFKPTIVLITIAANIGDTGLLQTEGCFTDSVVGLIPKKNVIPVFLELIMRGQKDYLNKVATTGAQKNINNEILREVSLLLPPVPEQQRIASCLSSLDALITAETKKLDALKTHKKGLMQQLFPSPEEVPA